MLMSTSYGNRTAPVLRGNWILERITSTPPAAPPPGVEALKENQPGQKPMSVRERLEMHRQKPSCNACHGVMDPLGFALENFDAIGTWRDKDREAGTVIDASSVLAGGTPINGPDQLRNALAARPDQFAQALTEKLLVFALGRTVEYSDMPRIRAIVKQAAKQDFRFSALIAGIVASEQFQKAVVAPEKPAAKPTLATHNQTPVH
jgi:hypothetical protein